MDSPTNILLLVIAVMTFILVLQGLKRG